MLKNIKNTINRADLSLAENLVINFLNKKGIDYSLYNGKLIRNKSPIFWFYKLF